MKKAWFWSAIVFIAIGIFLRLWQLGVVPDGLTWDEAAIGYNGWSVWTTRRDEWLHLLPISFRSFGDFKAPLAIYVNGPFTLLFGMHSWSIRLPFALAGSALLVVWFLLLRKLQKWGYIKRDAAVVFGVAALAFSPWHLMFSRIGFESGLSLFLLISGIFLLLWYITQKQAVPLLLGSAVLLSSSLYAYHSAKIVVPLLLLVVAIFWRKTVLRHMRHVVYGLVLGGCIAAPLLYDTVAGEGGTRAAGLIPLSGKPIGTQLVMVSESISANLRPLFLITGLGDEIRHVSGVYGPLTITVLSLFLLGVLILAKARNTRAAQEKLQFGLFSLLWAAIGFVPSFLSIEAPHANRAILALPGLLLLATMSLDWILGFISVNNSIKKNVCVAYLLFIFCAEVLFTGEFLTDYFTAYSARASDSFQTGYPGAVALAEKAKNHEQPFQNVEQIILSNQYGQPVIFTLANIDGAAPVSPYQYHQGYLVTYLFPDRILDADTQRKNTLLIWTNKDTVSIEPMGVISDRAGQPRFYWYVTGE